MPAPAHQIESPSPWVCRWAGLIRSGGRVLDVACGYGRHLRYLGSLGFSVVGVDRDAAALGAFRETAGVEIRVADIEAGPWPFVPGEFDGVVVTNYLHRPIFQNLVEALLPGGVLIYETFALGNERYGRPANPDHLLRRDELLRRVEPLSIIAFEQGVVSVPKPAVIQRICAVSAERGAAPLDTPNRSIGLE